MSEAFISRWSRLKRSSTSDVAETPLSDQGAVNSRSDNSTDSNPPAESVDSVSQAESVARAEAGTDVDQPFPASDSVSSNSEPTADFEPPLTDDDMPSLDTIHARSDVSMFFSSGVSPDLRRQALRKLFHQPAFNVRDPLDEYADDYSNMPLLERKVAATLKGWVGQQVRDALLAEEKAQDKASEQDPAADSEPQQTEQQGDAAVVSPQQEAELQQDQSLTPEFRSSAEDARTK